MKIVTLILLCFVSAPAYIHATEFNTAEFNTEKFNGKEFANNYFTAWTATQSPQATSQDIEQYIALLTEDVGHQHLPYDPDDTRSPEGKNNMRKGMNHYLGAHTEYTATLVNLTLGYDVVVIQYDTFAKGIHPQTKALITQQYRTVEVLEIEDGKVAVIRKYSE